MRAIVWVQQEKSVKKRCKKLTKETTACPETTSVPLASESIDYQSDTKRSNISEKIRMKALDPILWLYS